MKSFILEEINKINKVVAKMPNLNETLMFHEDEEPEIGFEDSLDDTEEFSDETELGVEPNGGDELINKIRKMALEGLSQLADNPEAPQYEALKKIWQFCEKKPSDNQKVTNQVA